jgi:hypothetical protein
VSKIGNWARRLACIAGARAVDEALAELLIAARDAELALVEANDGRRLVVEF